MGNRRRNYHIRDERRGLSDKCPNFSVSSVRHRGGSDGGETFYSLDGGATWQLFSPDGIDSTLNSQTFLEDARLSEGTYEIDLHYPNWVQDRGEPDRYTSPDGVVWTKHSAD